MMPKRVLIFSFVYYPRFIGGAEVAIKEITDHILPSDISFDLIALRLDKTLSKTEKIGNVTVHRIGFSSSQKVSADSLPWYLHLNKYLYPFLAAWEGARLHKKIKFDGIWSMMANYSGFGALFFKLFHSRIPFLLSLQEGDPIDYIKNRTRFVSPISRRIFTRADSVQTISHYLGGFAKNMGYKGVVHVVPNAVDTKMFSARPIGDESEKLKKKLHKENGEIFLITTSRLVVKNAVDDIIRSLVFLPKNVKFLILGIGYEEVKLKSLVRELRLEDRVIFLGFVPHHEMPKYLHISDIFIRPSISEGFGNSFVEAMAADIPVIATPVGGIVDFLFDPVRNPDREPTGLFCEVKNPESIALQVRRLLENPALRQQIVLSAHKIVFEKYDWSHIASDMKKVFADVLGN
jgi:glycosyltransferase involved in cell wall biosynthesis